MQREFFLAKHGDTGQWSTMVCIKLQPLSLLADELPERLLDALKDEVIHRVEVVVPDALACWSDNTLFLACDFGPGEKQAASTSCEKLAGLLREKYTLGNHPGDVVSTCLLEAHHCHLKPAIGLTQFRSDQPIKGVRHAELAAQDALADIGEPLAWFEPRFRFSQNEVRKTLGILQMLNEGSFELVYQPQIGVQCGTIKGLEVLIRAPADPDHPLYQATPPALIEGASSVNGLTDLTIQILLRTLWAYGFWKQLLPNTLNISVNVTPNTLMLGCDAILDALPSDIPLDWLTLEITEIQEYLAATENELGAVTQRIRQRGIQVSIDDFGKGLSNFDRLNEIECDEIKLDQSLVQRMGHQELDSELVNNIVTLANQTGLRVVAEGVETAGQWQLVKRAGCHIGQGFFFSPGRPFADITRLLAEQPLVRAAEK